MSKHHFTAEEIDNLSRLLLNEEEINIQLGLQLIEKNSAVLEAVEKEVLLIAQLHGNEKLRTKADQLLDKYCDKQKLIENRAALAIFKNFWRQTGWAKSHPVLEKYVEVHSAYAPYLEQNKLYLKKIENILGQVVDSYIWADNDLAAIVTTPSTMLPLLKKTIETITPTLLKTNPKHRLALECLMFIHAVPEYRSTQALVYYEQHQDLEYWAEWLYQRLGELLLFEVGEVEKAISFFEKASANKDFESLDLFIAKLANSIYLDRERPEQSKLADTLLQNFLGKYKESVHTHLLWANRVCQTQKDKTTIQQEYFKVLDRLPKGLMLTGNIGWVGLMYIDRRFKNEFDVEAFLEHTELLLEELPHPEQLLQAANTTTELLEWDNHPSYQDKLLRQLLKIKEQLSR